MFVCWAGVGVWMGVGCPCLPVRNNIVTFFLKIVLESRKEEEKHREDGAEDYKEKR